VRFAFILVERANYPVTVLCDVMNVSRSGFHAWCRRGSSARKLSDAELFAKIAVVHKKSRTTYGSPRIHADLRASGTCVSRKRVARLMVENHLRGRRKRRFRHTTDSNHTYPIAENLLHRDFFVEAPNTVWVTDVTAISTMDGWLFLAVMLDLFSRRVVGWATSTSNDTALALDALRIAVRSRRPPPGLMHHSDRGSPYASDDYREELRRNGFVQSMSRKGDCWDNAVAESFFGTIRAELIEHRVYENFASGTASIGEYINNFYNISRRHSFLDFCSPIEHELRCAKTALAT